jgi:glyoxylase-like metal-dependent hydrolase (beta-lactamase superfamily II)
MNDQPSPTVRGLHIGTLLESSAVRSFQLDDVTATYVVDGVMALHSDVFFPAIPADYWSSHPELLDASGRVVMSAGGLLIERDRRSLLIDTGVGLMSTRIHYGPVNCGAMLDVLASLGRRPEDIEVVAFTHLHFDHAGWAFSQGPDGHYAKTFPNARYVLSAREWDPHVYGEVTSTAAVPPKVVAQLRVTTRTLIDNDCEVFPGVRAMLTPGHSPGHTSYVITSVAGTRLVAFGDAFHIPAQLAHPDWPSAPDTDTAAVLASRHRLLDELLQPNTFGFGCHFGDQAFGRVLTDETGIPRWDPVSTIVHAPAPRTVRELD